jgi:DNA-binding MarR family transcriptional regulator
LLKKQLIVVQQSEMDKREYEINIADAGLDLLEVVGKDFKSKPNILGGLSVSEAFHLNALLDKLREG